jgi:hypothetical protein
MKIMKKWQRQCLGDCLCHFSVSQAWKMFGSGLPDSFLVQNPKPEKCTKLIQNAPNGHNMSQMSVKHSKWP